MKQIILLLLLSTFCLIQVVKSQTKLNLEMCLDLLQSQNEDIRQANINILLGKLEIKDTKNSYIPAVNFGVGNTYNLGLAFDEIAGQLITGNKWFNSVSANVSTRAIVFQGFTLKTKLQLSLIELESIELQKNNLEQSLKLELLSKFYEAVANKALYEMNIKQTQFAQEQLNLERTKFELETNTLVDLSLAESQLANSELSTVLSKTSYVSCLLELKQLLGIPLSDSIEIEIPSIKRSMFDITLLDIKEWIFDDPTSKIAELSVKQSELNLRYAKGAYYPTVSLFGGYGTNYSSERKDYITGADMPFFSQFYQNRSMNFGISVNVPIFDSFKTKNNITRMKLELEKRQSELNKTKVNREKIIILANQQYHKSVKEYQVLQTQSSSLEKNYYAMQKRYAIGVATAMEYNKSLLDYNIAEANVIKSRYNLMYNYEMIRVLIGQDLLSRDTVL